MLQRLLKIWRPIDFFSPASLILAIAAASAAVEPANAQMAGAEPNYRPPMVQSIDANGMSITQPRFQISEPKLSIGVEGAGGLSYQATRFTDKIPHEDFADPNSWTSNNLAGRISQSQVCTNPCYGGPYVNLMTVQLGNISDRFTDDPYNGQPFGNSSIGPGSPGKPVTPSGSSFTYDYANNEYTYTSSDGTRLIFEGFVSHVGQPLPFWDPYPNHQGLISRVEKPDGEVISWNYTLAHFDGLYFPRVQSVTNNLGYQIHFEYVTNTATSYTQLVNFRKLDRVTAIDNSVYACGATSFSCSSSGGGQQWPYLQYGSSGSLIDTVTDALGNTTTYTYELWWGRRLVSVRSPADASNDVTIAMGGTDTAQTYTLTNAAGTWGYAYDFQSTSASLTVTRSGVAGSRVYSLVGATAEPFIEWTETPGFFLFGQKWIGSDTLDGKTTSYHYDALMRPDRVTFPEGNYDEYTYDSRQNVTRIRRVAKPESTLADINLYADYPEPGALTCSNAKTCNKPNWTKDALNHQTNFTYDPDHGGLLTVTAPASGSGPYAAVPPQTRYTYSLNGTAVWRLASTSTCAATSTCVGAATETVIENAYNAKRLPSSVTTRAGDSSVSSTVTTTYTPQGDVGSIDGPLAGAADSTYRFYDAMRQLRATVGPDPDGAELLQYRVARTTYNADGNPTLVEQGVASAPGSWNSLSVLRRSSLEYDSFGRKTRESLIDPVTSTIQSVVQYSYDAAGRLDCTAVRMNPSLFGSLPSSACALGTQGANGPDRISRNTYDAADQRTVVTSAYGTSLQQATSTTTYSANGKPTSIADANGNVTAYEYDGFDRLVKTRYPCPTTGSACSVGDPFPNSSLTDFESLTLDAAGNVELRTLRRKDPEPVSTIAYSYDALNRETVGMLGVTSTYDNLNRVTSRTYGGQTVSFQYDALGRQTDETTWAGTVHRTFDAAGRRTAMTGPGGYGLGYDYLVTGEMTAVSYGVTYAYDDLGRRISMTRGNGVTTTYSYDASSALSQLTLDEAGAAYDQTVSYTRNAVGQILTKASSNSAFDLTARPNTTIGYTKNGLNQLTGSTVGSTTYNLSYDGRGNLTGDTVNTYGYDLANRLTSSNGWTLSYDAMGRLARITNGTTTTNFVYDGTNLIEEFDGGGNLRTAYVHGAGVDEPVVWYDIWTGARRWFAANEQGSVVTITDDSGNLASVGGTLGLNSYDEYGVPKSTNVGRFQYTGQTWLPEVGLYYYKARVYSPTLGRFLQTDPIGMKDDFNLYAYVGEDPVNNNDPTGQRCVAINSESPYCLRRDIYRVFDRDTAGRTRFFGAAAATVEYLANNDIPVLGNVLSDQAEAFLRDVSASLYALNARTYTQILSGQLFGRNLDSRLVHIEQTKVQSMIDALPNAQRAGIIASINRSFRMRSAAGFLSGSDSRYNRILGGVEDGLGRPIDFEKQSDREAIGNAIIKDLRSNGDCKVTGSLIPKC